jgi:hypothetical protein
VKLFLARPAARFGELVVCPVQDVEADVAFLDALESLVHVRLPHRQTVHNRAVLVLKEKM